MTKKDTLVRVAVDAMGGDNAPGDVVAGAVEAARDGDVQIMLVGDPEPVQAELAKYDTEQLPIRIIPSEGVLVEGEPPALALRQKPRASIFVATGMVKQGSCRRIRLDGFDRRSDGGGSSCSRTVEGS